MRTQRMLVLFNLVLGNSPPAGYEFLDFSPFLFLLYFTLSRFHLVYLILYDYLTMSPF